MIPGYYKYTSHHTDNGYVLYFLQQIYLNLSCVFSGLAYSFAFFVMRCFSKPLSIESWLLGAEQNPLSFNFWEKW